jgi:hypothetical protein
MPTSAALRRLGVRNRLATTARSTVEFSSDAQPAVSGELRVAVLVERRHQPCAAEDWTFRIHDVVIEEPGMGATARLLRDDGHTALFLFPGLPVPLHRDEIEGYRLNLASSTPSWFVLWRCATDDPSHVAVDRVTCSCHEAGRLPDPQQRMAPVPMPPGAVAWLAAFAAANGPVERRERRDSVPSRAPDDRC